MWEQNQDVRLVYATSNSQQAWAILSSSSGWIAVKPDSPDGVGNVTQVLSAAKVHGRKVDVYLDNAKISRALMR